MQQYLFPFSANGKPEPEGKPYPEDSMVQNSVPPTSPSTLFHQARPVVPDDISGFARENGTGILLKEENITYNPHQAELLKMFSQDPEKSNWVIQSPASDPTLALLAASPYLARSERVLILTPGKVNLERTVDKAQNMFTLPHSSILGIQGSVPKESRKQLYSDSRNLLTIATPEALQADITKGRVNLSDFSLVIIQEVDKAVGNSPYSKIIDAIGRDNKPRVLGLSEASSRSRIEDVMKMGFAKFEAVATKQHRLGEKVISVELSEDLIIASERLRRSARDTVKLLRKELGRGQDGRKAREQLNEICDKGIESQIPAVIDASEFSRKIKEIRNHHGDLYNRAYSLSCKLLLISSLHEELTTRGRFNFLNSCSEKLWEALGTKTPTYIREVFDSESPVARAFKQLAANTPYELLNRPDFIQHVRALTPAERKAAKKTFLKNAEDTLVESDVCTHPKEQEILKLLETLKGKTIVFTGSAHLARVLARRISKHSGQNAVCLNGQTGTRESEARLARFSRGEASVLVMNQKGTSGLTIPMANSLIMYPGATVKDLQRLKECINGEENPKESVFILMAKGTSDEAKTWAGQYKLREAKKVLDY